MLTAMGKMVQQIATINNLLIFINIQISQLQKSNEGRALGEGARYGRNLIAPCKGWEGQNSCQFWGERGAPLPAPRPLIPDLWGLRGSGGWNGSISSPGQGQAPCPGLKETRSPSAHGTGLRVASPALWGVVPRAGQAWQPLPTRE